MSKLSPIDETLTDEALENVLRARLDEIRGGSPTTEAEMQELTKTALELHTRTLRETQERMQAVILETEADFDRIQALHAWFTGCVAVIRDEDEVLAFMPKDLSPQRLAKLLKRAQVECQMMMAIQNRGH